MPSLRRPSKSGNVRWQLLILALPFLGVVAILAFSFFQRSRMRPKKLVVFNKPGPVQATLTNNMTWSELTPYLKAGSMRGANTNANAFLIGNVSAPIRVDASTQNALSPSATFWGPYS